MASGNNQGVLLLAALASIRLAQGLTADQMQLLANFFVILGDNLALLASPPCNKKADTEP